MLSLHGFYCKKVISKKKVKLAGHTYSKDCKGIIKQLLPSLYPPVY